MKWTRKKVKAFQKRQAECKSELVLCAEDSQLAHMYSSDTKAVWESLQLYIVLKALAAICIFNKSLSLPL
jgi:hypothetical protein